MQTPTDSSESSESSASMDSYEELMEVIQTVAAIAEEVENDDISMTFAVRVDGTDGIAAFTTEVSFSDLVDALDRTRDTLYEQLSSESDLNVS
jgi:hypothetical protein